MILLSATLSAADLSGEYAGEWQSSAAGSGGAIRFVLNQDSGGVWKCELSFSYAGAEVKTVMREVKVQDPKIGLTYDFDVQGATLQSHVTGEWSGTEFRGKYESRLADGSQIDAGTWSASRKK